MFKLKKGKTPPVADGVPDVKVPNPDVPTGTPDAPAPPKPEKQKRKKPSEPKEQKEHKVINSLVGNLSHALEEDVSEIDGMLELETKPQTREYHDRLKKPSKYRFFLIFGLIVFWLAIIGALSVVETTRELIYDISNQTALKEEFELFLFPVVVNDPPEFIGTETLQPTTVISSAIWQIILTGDTSNYERDLMARTMTIPESDVEAAARSIFGYGFDIRHISIDNFLTPFVYVPELKSYIAPESPSFVTYSPRAARVSSTGDVYRVIVEYIAPSPQSIAGIDYEIQPVKTMVYTITRTRNKSKAINSIEFYRDTEQSRHGY